jgi:transcriptional regulator with XRE-family HTH domain
MSFKSFTFVNKSYRKMNTRLQQFLAAENISQAQFAETIGVARASVSHILAGRNKPGFDFLESMIRHYPGLNLEWLLTGQGRMYSNAKMPFNATPEAISPLSSDTDQDLFAEPGYRQENALHSPPAPQNSFINRLDNSSQVINKERYITRITIFYSDGTFQEIE